MMDTNNDPRNSRIEQIKTALDPYQVSHPNAQIDVRPRYETFIGIRIIDPDFEGMDWLEREPEVWNLLEQLPDDPYTSITMVLLLTPEEAKGSGANMKFEDPIPSEF